MLHKHEIIDLYIHTNFILVNIFYKISLEKNPEGV